MANTNANIEYLKEYLNEQLDSTYNEIRETIVKEEYDKLLFRKAFLLTQLDNLQYQLSLNK